MDGGSIPNKNPKIRALDCCLAPIYYQDQRRKSNGPNSKVASPTIAFFFGEPNYCLAIQLGPSSHFRPKTNRAL